MEILRSLVKLWLKQYEYAKAHKRKRFDNSTEEIRRYYNIKDEFSPLGQFMQTADPHDQPFMSAEGLNHKIGVGLVGKWHRLMLPFVHYKSPHRLCTPRRPQIPPDLQAAIYMMQGLPPPMPGQPDPTDFRLRIAAHLLSHTLNYAAADETFDLRGECRSTVSEALLTGRGLVWTELVDTPVGELPGSFYESVENLFVDPDSMTMRDASYIIRKRRRPLWQFIEDFGLEDKREEIERKVKTLQQSTLQQAENDAYAEAIASLEGEEIKGDTIVYYEVYSRMGLGHRLIGRDEEIKKMKPLLDQLGEHIYLVVVPGLDWPANLPEDRLDIMSPAEAAAALEWPIATWGDSVDPWPFSLLDFYPNGLWPKPPLEDAMPIQKFLDYSMSYLMNRIKATSRDIIVAAEALAKNLTTALGSGLDQQVVTTDGRPGQDISSLIHILQFPPVNVDTWQLVTAAKSLWDEITGENDLMRGDMDKQMRSSAEAQIRQSNLMIRPNDMRDCVDAWQSRVACKEAIAQRLTLRQNVSAILGEQQDPNAPTMTPLTQAWMTMVATDDPELAATELTYSIAAGSGRRKNLAKLLEDINDSAQIILPMLMQVYQGTGDPTQINQWFGKWAEAMEAPELLIQFPPLQMQPQQQPGQPGEPGTEEKGAPPEVTPEEAMA